MDGPAGLPELLDLGRLFLLSLIQRQGGDVDRLEAGEAFPDLPELFRRQDVHLHTEAPGASLHLCGQGLADPFEAPLLPDFFPRDEDVVQGEVQSAPDVQRVVAGDDDQPGGLRRTRVVEDVSGIADQCRVAIPRGHSCLQVLDSLRPFHVRVRLLR
jgi:hypothetical protein